MDTAAAAGARETWLEECERHYKDYVCRGRAKRLLGRTWYPATTELTPLQTQLATGLPNIYFYCI